MKNEEGGGCDGGGLKGRAEMRRSIETCLNMTVCVTGLAEFQLLRRRAASVHAHCNAYRVDERTACTTTAGVDLKGKVLFLSCIWSEYLRDETGRNKENGIGWPNAPAEACFYERGREIFFSVTVHVDEEAKKYVRDDRIKVYN